MSFKRISVEEAQELIANGDTAIADVRDPGSYESGNIAGSINVSDTNVEDFLANLDKEKPVIVYCYHGNMSQGAADHFATNGCNDVYSVDGGYEDWRTKL